MYRGCNRRGHSSQYREARRNYSDFSRGTRTVDQHSGSPNDLEFHSQTRWISSPPGSPLALHVSRKLKREISWTQPLSDAHQFLDALHEEDETEVPSLRRTQKQKLDTNQAVPTSNQWNVNSDEL